MPESPAGKVLPHFHSPTVEAPEQAGGLLRPAGSQSDLRPALTCLVQSLASEACRRSGQTRAPGACSILLGASLGVLVPAQHWGFRRPEEASPNVEMSPSWHYQASDLGCLPVLGGPAWA